MERDNESRIVRFDFTGDEIEVAVRDGRVWVSVASVSRHLGLAPGGQETRLKRKSWSVMKKILLTGKDGKRYMHLCVDLDCLPMWLAIITTSRVRASLRPKLDRYQRQATKVLADHFLGARGGGAVLDDHPEVATEVKRRMRDVARKVHRTPQRVHGYLRRGFRVSSYRLISVARLEAVRATLREVEEGQIVISAPPELAAPPSARTAQAKAPPVRLPDPVQVTAADLHAAYDANEVAADSKYRDQLLRVTGRVAGVDRDFTGAIVIRLRTRSDYDDVMAYVDDADRATVATIKKGDPLTLLGIGSGRAMSSAIMRRCRVVPQTADEARREAARRKNAQRPRVVEEDGTVRYLDKN